MFALFGVVGGWITIAEPLHAQTKVRPTQVGGSVQGSQPT